MKNYRFLMPIVMIALIVASWFLLVQEVSKNDELYNTCLAEARDWAKDGITKYAIEKYEEALDLRSSPELYEEVALYYKAQDRKLDYLSWCELYIEEYPKEVGAYELLLDAYIQDQDYEDCYDLLEMAQKRNLKSETLDRMADEIAYEFKLELGSYDNVGIYSNNYCAVNSDGRWGFVDRYGKLRVSTRYVQTGAYTQSAIVSVVNSEGEAYFIDKSGAKVKVSSEKYESFGLVSGGKIAAKKTDGKYIYLDESCQALFGNYDYASTFNGGVAAVKTGDRWQLIDDQGNAITSQNYVDVILDEKQIAQRNGRIFAAKSEGQYIMLDNTGKQVGSLTFEDAKLFNGSAPAAVKIGGKWCFVDVDGKLISDKKYDDARSFANGMAAVCVDGKWGFVDESETIVIELQFDGAKDFNEKGSCFVQVNEKWKLLKLYRLNREG